MNRERDLTWVKDWRVLVFSVACTIAGFVVAMLIFGAPWHLPPDWGDIPTWFLVVLAAAGGWFTLSQLRIQQQQLKGQQDVFRREAEDRRKAQASRVFLWTEEGPDTTQSQAQRAVTGVPPGTVIVAHIKNSSQQPVYDLEVIWHQGAALRGSVEGLGVVMPDAQLNVTRHLASGPSAAVSGSPFKVALRFRDAAGVRWQVDQNGKLEEAEGG